jgi:hypothetical protein
MEKHPAVLALKPGCECRLNPEVSHWPELALELIHFLRLKRLYGDRVGCSGDVEKLWRYMLLDADEAENVYRLLGGPVPHSRKPSPVSTQVLAINMLVRDGHSISTKLWDIPGLRGYKVTVDSNNDDDDDDDDTDPFLVYGLHVPTVGMDFTAAGEAYGILPSQFVLVDWVKGEQQIQITVKTLTGRNIILNVDRSNTIKEVKEMTQDILEMPPNMMRFIFMGKQLEDQRTIQSYNIMDENVIHLVLILYGRSTRRLKR